MKSLAISQYQDAGTAVITQIKDIFFIFLADKAVLDGQMTFGMMLAIQYNRALEWTLESIGGLCQSCTKRLYQFGAIK